MSEFLDQMLNDEERRQKLVDAVNRANIEKWKEWARCMKEGFIMSSKEELIAATPELRELEAFLEKFQKEKPKPVLQWHETAGQIAGTGQALPVEPAEIIKKKPKSALRWYPFWSAFCTATPAGSNCFQCGGPLFGLATALCDECFEDQQKEKKDVDFKFSEWD